MPVVNGAWLVALGVLVLPIVVFLVLWALRLPGCGWRIAVLLWFAGAAGIVACWAWPLRLGVDLTGGTVLVYGLDPTSGAGTERPVSAERAVALLAKRLNPSGLLELTIRRYGSDAVEVTVPGDPASPELQRIKRMLGGQGGGTLEFRLVANRVLDAAIVAMAEGEEAAGGEAVRDSQHDRLLARWVPVDSRYVESLLKLPELVTRKTPDDRLEALVLIDKYNVTGEYLEQARAALDNRGEPCIDFTLSARGGQLFAGLTGENRPDPVSGRSRNLAIILAGKIYSAPAIRSTIRERGQINGNFTMEEVEDLALVLNSGSLPLTPEPLSEMCVGPAFGLRALQVQVGALVLALLLVQLFTLLYYRLVGLAACLAWLLNALMIVATMALLHVALSLTAIHALALTLLLTAVLNLLVCALVGNERKHGAGVPAAVRGGLLAALVPLVVVQLIVLVAGNLLYVFGFDSARAMGFTFALGSTSGLFTSVLCLWLLLGLVGRLLRNAGAMTTRILFPGKPPATVA